MLDDVLADLGHGLADGDVVVQQVAVLGGVPVHEGGQLLGDGVEQADNDADGSGLHVAAELVDGSGIGHAVVAVELHLLPDGKQDGSQHEDGGPVLEALTAVDTGVQGRELLKNLLLQLTPHVGHGALDLEVDHDGGDGPAVVLGVLVVDLAVKADLLALILNKGDVKSEVVSQDKLESLADDRHALLDVVAVSGLQDLSDEGGSLKVVLNEVLKAAVNVLVEVVGQSLDGNALGTDVKVTSAELKVDGLLVGEARLNPVSLEAAVVGDEDLADVDREGKAIAVSDPHQSLALGKALDVVDGDATAKVTLIVGLPVLHEVANVLDVNASARNLPQAGVRRLATSARLALVAGLLEELAAEASTELPDLAGLLALLRQERTLSTANLLDLGAVLLTGGGAADDGLGRLGSDGAPSLARVPPGADNGRRGGTGTAGGRRPGRGGRGRGRRLDGHRSNGGRRADCVVVVSVVVVVAEAVAVGSGVDISIGFGGEGRDGERGNLLIAAELKRVGSIRRVRVGSQMQRLAGVENCRVGLGLLEVVKASTGTLLDNH